MLSAAAGFSRSVGMKSWVQRMNFSEVQFQCKPGLRQFCDMLTVNMSPVVVIATIFSAVPLLAASCESLTSLSLPDTTITSAQAVVANKDLPPYCRVAATLKPSSDSDIKIEVWMPASGWNGKFEAVGNGG